MGMSVYVSSAMRPKLEALGRVGGNSRLSIWRKEDEEAEGKSTWHCRAGKNDLPSGGIWNLPFVYGARDPGDTQSKLGNPGVWWGLSNILIYFLKRFGRRNPPNLSAKPGPPLYLFNPSAVQGKSNSCVFNSFTLNVLKYCFVRAI
jgi:hypothetical protein